MLRGKIDEAPSIIMQSVYACVRPSVNEIRNPCHRVAVYVSVMAV